MAKASALLNTKTGLSCRNTDLSQTRLSFCLDAFYITSCGHWSVSMCSILMSFDGLDSRKAPFPYLSHHLPPPHTYFNPILVFHLSFSKTFQTPQCTNQSPHVRLKEAPPRQCPPPVCWFWANSLKQQLWLTIDNWQWLWSNVVFWCKPWWILIGADEN